MPRCSRGQYTRPLCKNSSVTAEQLSVTLPARRECNLVIFAPFVFHIVRPSVSAINIAMSW